MEKPRPNSQNVANNKLDDSYDDEQAVPMSSQLTDKELQHIEAMIKQVLLVTNSPQCGGDMQMAMDMMRLDDLEQAIVINSLREQFMKQKEPAAAD